MLQAIKPRNARSARAVAKREPKEQENPKIVLFLRGTTASDTIQAAISDLNSLKKPDSIKFSKRNAIHPFEDASSLEFFSRKNDASLLVFGAHSKKRPHCLTFVRCFDHTILDMVELYIDRDTFRAMAAFPTAKPSIGFKPLLSFMGTVWENPAEDKYARIKSILLDFFAGQEASAVDVAGLQYMIAVSAGEEGEGEQGPKIHLRTYMIKTKKSGTKVPRVEIEEMGPRIDFRVGRVREPDASTWREAMKKSKGTEPKRKKNIETDPIGDKVGRIHLGKQNLDKLQTRKMKGLKRSRDVEHEEEYQEMEIDVSDYDDDPDAKKSRVD
ncbi:MAG: rRNA-binding ribosome biosynthesis protein rpf2 [Vezdaea aestivalis]|nr:MAG: rRNA-binding ribosome biosynthesis protein rpf2 [Vezdaea aestivalis]